jgi:hypothetical protein
VTFHGACRGIHEQLRLRRRDIRTPGHVDHSDQAPGLGIMDRRRRARPRLHEAIEVLGAVDLHRSTQRERGAGGGGSDDLFGPVRACDETHFAGLVADGAVAFDPQEPAGGIPHGDDDPRIGFGQQKTADHVHRPGEGMSAPVRLELFGREVQRRQPIGADQMRE